MTSEVISCLYGGYRPPRPALTLPPSHAPDLTSFSPLLFSHMLQAKKQKSLVPAA